MPVIYLIPVSNRSHRDEDDGLTHKLKIGISSKKKYDFGTALDELAVYAYNLLHFLVLARDPLNREHKNVPKTCEQKGRGLRDEGDAEEGVDEGDEVDEDAAASMEMLIGPVPKSIGIGVNRRY